MTGARAAVTDPVISTGSRLLWSLLIAVLVCRLLAMLFYPITDTTEARYTEISRLMLESGDWIMPLYQPGVPFWGKPPLFAWLTAGSFSLFDISEFSARLPHFLVSLVTLWLVARLARTQLTQRALLLALVVLVSTPLFFAGSGTVMTESGLLFSTTLSMTGFWLFYSGKSRWWGLAFFAGLGLGMLAKGPVAVVLTGLPLLIWLTTRKQWHSLAALPWVSGCLLALAISMPWYVAAEMRSPGFLQYFLIGEHVLRFIEPGWGGDLYGKAHHELPGMIWPFWFKATAAWGLMLAFVCGRFIFQGMADRSRLWPKLDEWQSYLLWWMLAPLLFFTFSGNILWTYAITGIPAFALLMATPAGSGDMASPDSMIQPGKRFELLSLRIRPLPLSLMALLVPVLSLAHLAATGLGHGLMLSEKELIGAYHAREQNSDRPGARPLYYLNYIPVSAEFYSRGEASMIDAAGGSRDVREFWLAVHETLGDAPHWSCSLQYRPKRGIFELYLCKKEEEQQ